MLKHAMLSAAELQAFRTSIAQVRSAAAKRLAQSRDVGQVVAFVANLQRGLDAVAERASASGPLPECQIGCAHCCHLRVEATDPEIFRIAASVRQWPAGELAELCEKLRRHQAEADAGEARPACGFLADSRCTIYALRPAACRKAHSYSRAACASGAAEIPQNLKLLADAEALMIGTAEAYGELGLFAAARELNASVLTALVDAAAEARWFAGEDVF